MKKRRGAQRMHTMRREKRALLAEARARPARSPDSASMCTIMDREKKKEASVITQ